MEDVNLENREHGCLGYALGERRVGLEAVRDGEMKRLPSPGGWGEQVHRPREDIQYGALAVVPVVEIDGYV